MSPDILVTISVWNQIKPQYIVIHVVTEGENVSMFSATEYRNSIDSSLRMHLAFYKHYRNVSV